MRALDALNRRGAAIGLAQISRRPCELPASACAFGEVGRKEVPGYGGRSRSRSPSFNARGPYYLGPLVGEFGDYLPELRGRARKCRVTKFGDPTIEPGIG
jgi:hypothetical protein